MSTEMLILAFLAVAVLSCVVGVVLHAMSTRQASPTLTLDAIKGATTLLSAARAHAAAEVRAAKQREEAIALALKHASDTLATPAA